jgi:hypothetical protein
MASITEIREMKARIVVFGIGGAGRQRHQQHDRGRACFSLCGASRFRLRAGAKAPVTRVPIWMTRLN